MKRSFDGVGDGDGASGVPAGGDRMVEQCHRAGSSRQAGGGPPATGAPCRPLLTTQTRTGLGVLNTTGAIETKGHPFFEPIGRNGRACITCHQPSDAMSLSAATARERWRETGGKIRFSRPSTEELSESAAR